MTGSACPRDHEEVARTRGPARGGSLGGRAVTEHPNIGRGRCPPCLLRHRSPRISAKQNPAVPHPERAGAHRTSIPATAAASKDFGPNEWLVDELYQRYLADPGSVDMAWWNFFADYSPPAGSVAARAARSSRASPRTRLRRRRQGPNGGPAPAQPSASHRQAGPGGAHGPGRPGRPGQRARAGRGPGGGSAEAGRPPRPRHVAQRRARRSRGAHWRPGCAARPPGPRSTWPPA